MKNVYCLMYWSAEDTNPVLVDVYQTQEQADRFAFDQLCLSLNDMTDHCGQTTNTITRAVGGETYDSVLCIVTREGREVESYGVIKKEVKSDD